MNTSETTAALITALAKAQAQIGAVEKDSRNPHLKNRYATHEAMLRATKLPLLSNGLIVFQTIGGTPGTAAVTTRIAHVSGEWIEETVTAAVPPAKGINPMQALGLSITYLRRYSYSGILGLVATDDDDAAGLIPPEPPKRWSQNEQRGFFAKLKETGTPINYEDLTTWLESVGRPRPSTMTAEQRKGLLSWIQSDDAAERIAIFLQEDSADSNPNPEETP